MVKMAVRIELRYPDVDIIISRGNPQKAKWQLKSVAHKKYGHISICHSSQIGI